MIGGAVFNAASFIGGNYLAKYLSGDGGKAAMDEKIRHDKALEAYQAAYLKYQKDRTELLDWIAEQDRAKDQARHNFQDTDQALDFYNQAHRAKVALPKEPQFFLFFFFFNLLINNSLTSLNSTSPAHSRSRVSSCSLVRARLRLGMQLSLSLKCINILMDAKLSKIYYSPKGYWKGLAAVKKLAAAAKVAEDVAKKWLAKQAFWQIYLPAPRCIPRPKFDVFSPNAVHQADLLFLPHDKLPHLKKVYKYALTVVDVASRYKAAEPLTSKESDEVSKAFQKNIRTRTIKNGPNYCRLTLGVSLWGL